MTPTQTPPFRFDYQPRFTRELPGDPSGRLQPRQTPAVCWSHCPPTPVAAPHLVAWFPEVAELLGLSAAEMGRPETVEVLAGNRVLPGMTPYAACYGGHQFGQWAGQLGDGRAVTLAEIVHDGRRWDLQLKGAGLTPYSRTADGRAVLRSSIREFLCSEAMYHLGIPTTRALSLVATGERVVRDCSTTAAPRPSRGPSCVAWRRRSSAWATSRSSPRATSAGCSTGRSTSPSTATSRRSPAPGRSGAPRGSSRCAGAPRGWSSSGSGSASSTG